MRPLRLDVRGFTSFKEPATLDFEHRRLFAITGPTGAGKSSLLDAMTWALYGQVPRVGRETRQLITHGAKAMAVQFEFSVRGDRYRVSRQAPGNLGARLEQQRADGVWEPLEDRAREVTRRIEDLLGLDFATFTKTVLLPQGAFDTFLRGDEPQRRDILTRLLGLGRYEEAGRAARNRAAGARSAAGATREQIERLDAATPEAITHLEREHASLAAHVETLAGRTTLLVAVSESARATVEAESAAGRAATASAEATRDAESARDALDRDEQGREQARADRDRLDMERAALGYDEAEHRRLEREAQMLDQREAARRAVEAAEAEQCEAVEGARRAATNAERLHADADTAERAREEADTASRAAHDTLAAAAAAALATERALGEAANTADDRRVSAELAAAERDEEARRLTALDERLRARQQVLAAAGHEHDQATAAQTAAQGASDAASERLGEAEGRRAERAAALDLAQRQDAAMTLRQGLQPGDPCPVCGEPISHIDPHIPPELDAARTALDAAEAVLRNARSEQATAATTLAAAEADAMRVASAVERANADLDAVRAEAAPSGVDVDSLTEAAEQASADAEAERARAAVLVAERDRAGEAAGRLGILRASIGDALAGLDTAEADAADPEGVHAALDTAIEEHRAAGAEAALASERARTAAERSREAHANVQRAGERRTRADAELDRAREHLSSLGAADADADAVRSALADAQQQAARHREIEAALGSAREALARADERVGASREALARAEETATRRAAEATEALAQAEDARRGLAEAWTAAAVEGAPDTTRAPRLLDEHRVAVAACERERDLAAQRLETARADAERAEQMRADAATYDGNAELADDLARELRRDRFIAYVQREAMYLLAADAGERLRTLSSGRYRLVVRDEAFWVVDGFNGDERRSVKTLSGGETFLASLALALALSERLPEIAGRGGAMSLESLFLDEGFGALDQDSLDTAIGGLETLAGGQRLVGVISHIPEVAERLPDRVEVVKNGATSRLVTPGAVIEAGVEPSLTVTP
ncbi:MAG: SMC family ATPase [Chloroflexota bacterium]|nr:SMC family ATPase [Chloroflexota bacterium]